MSYTIVKSKGDNVHIHSYNVGFFDSIVCPMLSICVFVVSYKISKIIKDIGSSLMVNGAEFLMSGAEHECRI